MRGAVARRGAFTLGPVDLQIDWADRVAITGANGSGKTTLLAGAARPDTASTRGMPRWALASSSARSTRRAGCSWAREPLMERLRRRSVPEYEAPADIRTLLAKFGLRAAHVLRPADTLSPGERTRAALALLQARGVNLLVLDEPTNHLDLPAIEQLEEALASYPGTLLLVTHDRRMLEAVTVNRRLEVAGGTVTSR
jgi:ATPase subunit of ABC transporter with duplicated ATPase domains